MKNQLFFIINLYILTSLYSFSENSILHLENTKSKIENISIFSKNSFLDSNDTRYSIDSNIDKKEESKSNQIGYYYYPQNNIPANTSFNFTRNNKSMNSKQQNYLVKKVYQKVIIINSKVAINNMFIANKNYSLYPEHDIELLFEPLNIPVSLDLRYKVMLSDTVFKAKSNDIVGEYITNYNGIQYKGNLILK